MQETKGLLSLKDSSAENKQILSDWASDKPTCTWIGVTCSSGRVTEMWVALKCFELLARWHFRHSFLFLFSTLLFLSLPSATLRNYFSHLPSFHLYFITSFFTRLLYPLTTPLFQHDKRTHNKGSDVSSVRKLYCFKMLQLFSISQKYVLSKKNIGAMSNLICAPLPEVPWTLENWLGRCPKSGAA